MSCKFSLGHGVWNQSACCVCVLWFDELMLFSKPKKIHLEIASISRPHCTCTHSTKEGEKPTQRDLKQTKNLKKWQTAGEYLVRIHVMNISTHDKLQCPANRTNAYAHKQTWDDQVCVQYCPWMTIHSPLSYSCDGVCKMMRFDFLLCCHAKTILK